MLVKNHFRASEMRSWGQPQQVGQRERKANWLSVGLLSLCAVGSVWPVSGWAGHPIANSGEGLSVFVAKQGEVIATYQGNSAAYSNDLYFISPKGPIFLFNNHNSPVGSHINLGSFTPGTELVFRLHVNNTGKDFFTGYAGRNPDNQPHARVQENWQPKETLVSFEDLYNGPFGYNDLSFSFSNTTSQLSYTAMGVVKDKLGQPLAGVTVELGDQTTTTDATGHWEIANLPAGEYPVTLSQGGYVTEAKTCVISNNQVCPEAKKVVLSSLLQLQVVAEPIDVIQPGDDVTYTMTVTNTGTDLATGIVLSEVLPVNTTLVSLEALEDGLCETSTLSCTLPDLMTGASATVKLVVNNTQAETLVNTATVIANEYPSDIAVTTKEVNPYLSVTPQCDPNPVDMQKTLHCVLTVDLNENAPEPTATGVQLVTTLPKGVALQTVTTDFGACDTSQLPLLTCNLNDLSLVNAEDVHQATVNMDLLLTDAGLLVLTQEPKVTASNYPAHSVRVRTNIRVPPEIQVDIALVIDVTGSMQGEINGTIAALKTLIGQLDPKNLPFSSLLGQSAPLMTLVVFKDEVTVKAFTKDLNVLLQAIESLKASGGGTCPEASVEALLATIPHVKAGGTIWFTTDASPYPDANLAAVNQLLQSKHIRFNATVTGDCTAEASQN